jgi:carboxypeptidase Q
VLIRSIGTDHDRLPHTGTLRYADDVPQIPAAALSQPDADNLALQLQTGQTVRFRLYLTCRLEAEMRTSANVLAEVLGREKPDEVVLLAAHLDSWDLGTGALDNGAGCAIIAAAAQLIGQLPQPPRRTIRVLLTANEEFGLSGARAYAEKYQAELGSHVAALESDFGAGRLWALRSLVKEDKVPLVRAWAELLAPLGIVYRDNSARGGADLSALAAARIPLFDLRQDGTAYFDYHHTANDTLDKVVPAELQQNVAGYATLVYLLAENPENLGRAPEPAP